jgi:hypothetical protein
MPYIFPKRRLRDKDVLDPVELNEDFIPAAEMYIGGLNAHNIQENINPEINTSADKDTPYYSYKFVSTDVSPEISSGQHPSTANITNHHQIRNDFTWSKIDSAEVEISTGISTLWITSLTQYFWLGFTSDPTSVRSWGSGAAATGEAKAAGHFFSFDGSPAGVQFAIRVDGAVIEHTITGRRYPFENSVEPVLSTRERGDSSTWGSDGPFPGPHGIFVNRLSAYGPEVFPVRLGCHYPVQPGKHTVEVVARRIPTYEREIYMSDSERATTDDNYIIVTTRKLFVMELKRFPTSSSTMPSLTVEAFDSEDEITETALQTDRVDTLRTAYNTVKNGSLARGALTHYHLASPVIDKNTATFAASATASLDSVFPGHPSSTINSTSNPASFNLTSSSAGSGFFILENTSDFEVLSGASSATGFDVSQESIFIVTANVQLNGLSCGLYGTSGSTGIATSECFGSLAIGFEASSTGVNYIVPDGIVYVNSYNTMGYDHNVGGPGVKSTRPDWDRSMPSEQNVSLFHVFSSSDLSTITGGNNVYKFKLFGSTMNPTAQALGITTTMTYKRANISVIQLKM